jgi:hypothetical protein
MPRGSGNYTTLKPLSLRDLLRDLQAHRSLGADAVIVEFGGAEYDVIAVDHDPNGAPIVRLRLAALGV